MRNGCVSDRLHWTHFNLTETKSLSKDLAFCSLGQLIKSAFVGAQSTIEAELNAQLDQFIAGVG